MKFIYKKKYILIIFTAVFLLSSFLYMYIQYYQLTNKVHVPHFIQYNSYVAAQKGSSYILNLTYFVPKYGNDEFHTKNIQWMEFENSNGVKIKDFKINDGSMTNNYQIRTLVVTTEFINEFEGNINYIKVYFDDGGDKSYKIGDWKFDVLNLKQSSYLRVGERYPLATARFINYTLAVDNLSDSNIKIEKLITGLRGTDFAFDGTIISPKQSFREDILPITKDNKDKETSFYYLRPLVQYSKDGEIYGFYPDGVYFGLLNINDVIIKKEIAKTP